jgi:hypothetical protein
MFKVRVKWDKITHQWELSSTEIEAYACGDTFEETLDMLADNIMALREDYFNNIKTYLNIPNMKKQYPYYLWIKAYSKEMLLELLKEDIV